jgi:hypothetical protein
VGAGGAAKTRAGVDGKVQCAGRKLMVAPARSKPGQSRLATVGDPGGRGRRMAAWVKGVRDLMQARRFDRTILEMRGSSPKIISGDSR